jgi:hypothetical protein
VQQMQRSAKWAIRVTSIPEPRPRPNTYLPPTPSTTGPPAQIIPVAPAPPPMTTIQVEVMTELVSDSPSEAADDVCSDCYEALSDPAKHCPDCGECSCSCDDKALN